MKTLLLGTILLGAATLPAHEPTHIEWLTDFEAAKSKAAEEGKDILINFTGSDWCVWCHRLEGEVFNMEDFHQEAEKLYVFLMLDFPREKPQTEEIKKKNQELQQHFGVQGFPTIFLTDSKGRGYGRTGYQQGGPAKYLEHLAELRKTREQRDAMFTKASESESIGRAKLLDQALTMLDGKQALVGYGDVIEEIKALDSNDTAGLRKRWVRRAAIKDSMKTIDDALRKGELDAALKAIDNALTNHEPEGTDKQNLLFTKAMLYGQAKGDTKGAMGFLKEAVEAAPDSDRAPQLKAILKQVGDMLRREQDEEAKKSAEKEAEKKKGDDK